MSPPEATREGGDHPHSADEAEREENSDERDDECGFPSASQSVVWDNGAAEAEFELRTPRGLSGSLRRQASGRRREPSSKSRESLGGVSEHSLSPDSASPSARVLDMWRRHTRRRASPRAQCDCGDAVDAPSAEHASAERVERTRRGCSIGADEMLLRKLPLVEDAVRRQVAPRASRDGRDKVEDDEDAAAGGDLEASDPDLLALFEAIEAEQRQQQDECARNGTGVDESTSVARHPWLASMSGPAAASTGRMLVLRVEVPENRGYGVPHEKLLYTCRAQCRPEAAQQQRAATLVVALRDSWFGLEVRAGDVVNVVLCDDRCNFCPFTMPHNADECAAATYLVVDSNQNLAVLLPDVMISGTSVSNAFSCKRRVVLGERNRYSVLNPRTSKPALRGTMLHQLFQLMLVRAAAAPAPPAGADDGGEAVLADEDIERVMRQSLVELYAMREEENELRAFLRRNADAIVGYVRRVQCAPSMPSSSPPATARAEGEHVETSGHMPLDRGDRVRITGVSDVEESVWSPLFGLKGKIDATVSAELSQHGHDNVLARLWMSSLELKTGRSTGMSGVAHCAQLIIYSLLLSERYDASITAGLLMYLQPATTASDRPDGGATEAAFRTKLVPTLRAEVVGLLMARNALARYLDTAANDSLVASGGSAANGGACADSARESSRKAGCDSAQEGRSDELGDRLARMSLFPPPLQERENICSRCFQRDSCQIMHRVVGDGAAESSPLPAEFAATTAHLTPAHVAYYRHWLALTRLEEEYAHEHRLETWCMPAAERQASGRCVAGAILEHVERVGAVGGGRYSDSYRHQFRADAAADTSASASASASSSSLSHSAAVSRARHRAPLTCVENGPGNAPHSPRAPPLLADGGARASAGVVPGDYVAVSAYVGEDAGVDWVGSGAGRAQKTALAFGFVRAVEHPTACALTVTLDLERDCQRWLRERLPQCEARAAVRWRIDKEELSSGFSTIHCNLEALFLPERLMPGAERMRELVVDLAPPRFAPNSALAQLETDDEHLRALNPEQQSAVRRILEAQDYALVLGMPGTGKTATIACTVAALVRRGSSVLLASHTHSAVDNVLLRLVSMGCTPADMLRLGRTSSVDQRLHAYTLYAGGGGDKDGNSAGAPRMSLNEFAEHVDGVPLVASTCFGVSSPVFYRRTRFDYVIVDEASQIPQPVSLGPVRFARRAFVLVGDHHQLPPLARSDVGRERGAGESLFRRLCEAHPEAVTRLRRQYRMAEDIMALSNALVYEGMLMCGSAAVAQQRLVYRDEAGEDAPAHGWLHAALDPQQRVVFLNTDGIARAHETKRHDVVTNGFEAEAVARVVHRMVRCGVGPGEIGVTSPLRAQVQLIRQCLLARCSAAAAAAAAPPSLPVASHLFECRTIDQFQGRDKDVILVSLVRHNGSANIGQVLRDWRRINVAVTRAKKKLVLIGSHDTLRTSKFLQRMLEDMRQRGWIVDMAAGPE